MSNPIEQPKTDPVFAAIAVILGELNKLSNKEAREVLTMVSAVRNLRVVSMGGTIVPNMVGMRPPPGFQGGGPQERKTKSTPPAPWKSQAKWREANVAHAALVDRVKKEQDQEVKDGLISKLRDSEIAMKSLKRELRGFHSPT